MPSKDVSTFLPGLSEVWERTLGDPGLTIAVLDGPADLGHPSLQTSNISVVDGVVPGSASDGPASHHGTHVTSIIFGDHSSEIQGIAPRCHGLLVPIFSDASETAIKSCTEDELARAIHIALDHEARIVNVSGGRFAIDGESGRELRQAVQRCSDENSLLVAAVGNDGCDCHQVPAALENVLPIGAATADGQPLEFSNWGRLYRSTGVLVPGFEIPGATPGGGSSRQTGTSFAAPIASGFAGLLMSLQLKDTGKLDSGRVRAAIVDGAVGCDELPAQECDRVLAGQIHVGRTFSLITRGASEVTEQTNIGVTESTTESVNASCSSTTVQPDEEQSVSSSPEQATVQPATAHTEQSAPTAPVIERTESESSSVVSPSACGCGGNASSPLVYALGRIGYDFGTQARYDSFLQYMRAYFWRAEQLDPLQVNPYNPEQMVVYLENNPESATDLIWTLKQSDINLYSITPSGAFGSQTYTLLEEFLKDQYTLIPIPDTDDKVPLSEINAIPGHIRGTSRLYNGQVVQSIEPDYRGMANWSIEKLVGATGEALSEELVQSTESASRSGDGDSVINQLRNFLSRIYYEFENMGLEPGDRALNYAGTNLWDVFSAFWKEVKNGFVLSTFSVEPSKLCRPDSSCWDVKLIFFDPTDTDVARNQYLLTIDVSDIVPVTLGAPKSWSIY